AIRAHGKVAHRSMGDHPWGMESHRAILCASNLPALLSQQHAGGELAPGDTCGAWILVHMGCAVADNPKARPSFQIGGPGMAATPRGASRLRLLVRARPRRPAAARVFIV